MKAKHTWTTVVMMGLLIAGAVLLYTLADQAEVAGALALAAITLSTRSMKVVGVPELDDVPRGES